MPTVKQVPTVKQTLSFIIVRRSNTRHLRSGSTLVFKGLDEDLQAVERQAERLRNLR